MMRVGDKVKINIPVLEETGLCDCDTQVRAYNYIIDHTIVGSTSFFEDELINVGEDL